jgi:Zn-dependent protease
MNGIAIARLLGFEIRVHLSWALVLAVIVVSVVSQIEALAPTVTVPVRWAVGGVVAAAFFGSAVLHELAHAIVARRAGVQNRVLVVLFFGGTTSPGIEAARPRDEVAIALAGPITSLVLGVALVVPGVLLVSVGGETAAVGEMVVAIGLLNLLLGAVNLLPAFPLDGGRLIQGLAWARTGDTARGIRIAAQFGRLLGWLITGLGFAVVVLVNPIDGLMLGILGWFLTSAAGQVERRALFDDLLEGVPASDAIERDAPEVGAGLTLDTFASRMLDGTVSPSLPVMRDRELVGIVSASQLRRVRRQRWAELRAEDLMVATDALPRVEPDTSLRSVLETLRRTGLDALPVIGATGLTGIVTRRAVVEALRQRAALRGMSLP